MHVYQQRSTGEKGAGVITSNMATAKRRKVQGYWDEDTLRPLQAQTFIQWPENGIDVAIVLAQITDIEEEGRSRYQCAHVFVSPVDAGPVRELFRVKVHKYEKMSVMVGMSAEPEDMEAKALFEEKLRKYVATCDMLTVKYNVF